MKATYKVHLDPTCNSLAEVSFDQVLEIKGRKTFRRTPSQERAARARIDRPKRFTGRLSLYGNEPISNKSLEEIAARGDTKAYVEVFLRLNKLKV